MRDAQASPDLDPALAPGQPVSIRGLLCSLRDLLQKNQAISVYQRRSAVPSRPVIFVSIVVVLCCLCDLLQEKPALKFLP
jgi:hypothetical protein